MLNIQNGNMYDWVTHTWNPIKGECPFGCHYCYMKKWGTKLKPIRLVESELKTDLQSGNTIFVGSSCDMWASPVRADWIKQVLNRCCEFPENTYLFQSKDPVRFLHWIDRMPPKTIFGTTIESNLRYPEMGDAPDPILRYQAIKNIKGMGARTMITIEPIMKFGQNLIEWIIDARPDFVNIGANTNSKVKLSEPSKDAISALIDQISPYTRVNIKPNLKRLR